MSKKEELIERIITGELGSIDRFGLEQYYQQMRYQELFEEDEAYLLELLDEDYWEENNEGNYRL